jgi:hypothetical protein
MSHAQRRVDPRLKVTIRARLRDRMCNRDVCILNVSARGFLASAAIPPPRGEFVEIMLGPSLVVGQVRWASQHRFGIVLQEKIDVTSIACGDFSNFRAHVSSLKGDGQRQALRPEAAAERSRRIVRWANGVIAAAACLVAALFLPETISENLGSLDKATQAMSQSRANLTRR